MMKAWIFIIMFAIFIFIMVKFSPTTAELQERRRLKKAHEVIEIMKTLKKYDSQNIEYLSIDIKGMPHQNKEIITNKIGEFQANNPDKEIVQFFIEFQQEAHGSVDRWTFGIWILSKDIN